MGRLVLLVASILGCLSFGLSQTSAKPVPAFDQQVIDQQKQFLQAVQAKNAAFVERTVADDFQGIGTNGDFYDREDVVESAHDGVPAGMRAYDFHVVKLNDESAVVAYNLIVPGEHPRYRHMSDTWAKIDGRWFLKFRQITANAWSANDLD
jgi:hypothetical protein